MIKIGFLYRAFRVNAQPNQDRSRIYPLLMGIGFAAGWNPCVGPVLAAILLLAGESGSAFVGIIYLLAYSLGLMLPFLFVGYFLERGQKLI